MANCKGCGGSVNPPHVYCRRCSDKQRMGQQGEQRGGQNAGGARGGEEARQTLRPYDEYKAFLAQGYFDDKGYLREDLITTWPNELAQGFKSMDLSTGQLRRFYAHARRAAQRMEYGESFDAVRPAILEMKPLVADAVGRAAANKKDYDTFRDFIDRNVTLAAQERKQFEEGFLKHFMYVVAYFKYHNPKEATRG